VVRARQLPRELVAHACRRVAAACTSESGARAALLGLDVIHACPLRESEREREKKRDRQKERERERGRAREGESESERAREGCLLGAHKQDAQHTQESEREREEKRERQRMPLSFFTASEEEEAEYYLVDVNHFPGFHGMESFPEALAILIQRRLLLARTLLPQTPPRPLEEEEKGGGGGGGGGDWDVTIARAGRYGKAEERAACTNVWEDTEEIGFIEPLQPFISMCQ